MDVLRAMGMTLEQAIAIGMDNVTSDSPRADYEHLRSMYDRAIEFVDSNPEKANRWLGWMQCAVYTDPGFIEHGLPENIFETINQQCGASRAPDESPPGVIHPSKFAG